jgi:hypothetical protein
MIAYPDDLYAKIVDYTQRHGTTPEEALITITRRALEIDETNAESGAVPDDDPFFQLAGCLASGTPDLGLNHDQYLAEAYADAHGREN